MAGAEGNNGAGHLSAIFLTFSKSVVIAGAEGDDAGEVVTAGHVRLLVGHVVPWLLHRRLPWLSPRKN